MKLKTMSYYPKSLFYFMEDITKHTIKIVRSMRNPETPLGKKIAEITMEILIITFAVTLAQFLDRQRERDVRQKEVAEFLSGLKVDLQNDIRVGPIFARGPDRRRCLVTF